MEIRYIVSLGFPHNSILSMPACSHTPKTVTDTRFLDHRCENCRMPRKNIRLQDWLDGFSKFLTPSVSEIAKARRLRLESELAPTEIVTEDTSALVEAVLDLLGVARAS